MTKAMRFKPLEANQAYNCPTGYWWVGHPNCGSTVKEDRELINNRDKLWFISGVSDPDADYSYDEYALVRLKRVYYLCETSGCSCPDPSETWCVFKKGTKQECLQAVAEKGGSWVEDWALNNGWKERNKP